MEKSKEVKDWKKRFLESKRKCKECDYTVIITKSKEYVKIDPTILYTKNQYNDDKRNR